jgi:hypothetical protein
MAINDTAAIVTAFFGNNENFFYKQNMARTLCRNIKRSDIFTCLASHSTIDEKTQSYTNISIYDADNSFQINGKPNVTHNHGVAELTSMHNAVNALKRFGFKYIIKFPFDIVPEMDFIKLIDDCKATGKKLVTGRWDNDITIGTFAFFAEIDFFLETFSLDEIYRCDKDLEYAWFDSVNEKGLLEQVHFCSGYNNFMGNNMTQYSEGAGTKVSQYPFR